METMSFPEYRELLVHINKEHSPVKNMYEGRQVKQIDCSTDMRNGQVFWVKIFGYGWEKTFEITGTNRGQRLLSRIHAFLDQAEGAEDVDPPKIEVSTPALRHVMSVITGEFGRQCQAIGDDFGGAAEFVFRIPADVLRKAIQEVNNENSNGMGNHSAATQGNDS